MDKSYELDWLNHGFIATYTGMHDMPAQSMIDKGFFPKGTKVKFINQNGYEIERETALKILGTEQVLTVNSCEIGMSASRYRFEEVQGTWNSVMFEKVLSATP